MIKTESSSLAKQPSSLLCSLRRLWHHLSRRRRFQCMLIMGLTLASAFAEVVNLGAVLPFIGILTVPDQVFHHPDAAKVVQFLGITSADQLVLPFTIAFITLTLMAGAIRMLLLWAGSRLSNASGADLAIEVYRRTLYQPYPVHVARNTSTVISGINKVNNAQAVLLALLTLISSVVLMVSVILALLAIDVIVATVAAIGFGSSYGLIVWLSRRRLQHNGQVIARESTQLIKTLQEGMGNIRDVLLDNRQSLYCDIFRRSRLPLKQSLANNHFIEGSPRYVMEAMGMVLIAALTYGLSRQTGGIASVLPMLGALALGAQRLLPALQQSFAAWAQIIANQASLDEALELLDQPLPADMHGTDPLPLVFQDAIQFDSVRFRYGSDKPWVLDGLNFTIPKGSRVGFVGSTGSGKSTTLDLFMGLLEPTHGAILVDGHPVTGKRRQAWQKIIAHVPQSIYLADTTIAENIAFGVPREAIGLDRVRQAAREAQIADFIEARPEGYYAFVGERGVRLSGGQRQRIGIARAFYKQAAILVFDEATSALDNTTEQMVIDAIENFERDLTVLLIAHRLTTVRHCDIIIELEHGRMVACGSYDQLFEHSASFRRMARVGAG